MLALLFFAATSGLAQSTPQPTATLRPNPPLAACGLPTEGEIYQSVTYTLTANCTQTDFLRIDTVYDTTVTIEGNGHTIDASALTNRTHFITVRFNSRIIIRNVTIDGGGNYGTGALNTHGSSTLNNVTFRNSAFSAIAITYHSGSHSFSNLLIENVTGGYFHRLHQPSAVWAWGGVDITINNLMLRNVIGGNAAIHAGSGAPFTGTASVRLTGCFSSERVFPQVLSGSVTDSNSGPCSGAIGNGGSAARQYSAPTAAACGFPTEGVLERSAVYNLSADCTLTGRLFIPKGLTVTINGGGHAISGNYRFDSAANLTVRDAVISGQSITIWLINTVRIENTVFRGNTRPFFNTDGNVTFDNTLFENNSVTSATLGSAFYGVLTGTVTFRDTVFRGNSGGLGALAARSIQYDFSDPQKVFLEGCLTLENNLPLNISDPSGLVTNNSAGECPPFKQRAFYEASPGRGSDEPSPRRESDKTAESDTAEAARRGCHSSADVEALRMGAAACIFRFDRGGDDVLQVYGLDSQGAGFHLLTLTQAQVDAHDGEAVVAVSADGRALAVVWDDGNITVKVGPDGEGKVLHTTFGSELHGAVIGTTTTYGPAPGLAYLAAAPPTEAAQNCLATTTHILNFRDAPAGNIIAHLPTNITLTVLAQIRGWLHVDYHGQAGWISADYAVTQGNC